MKKVLITGKNSYIGDSVRKYLLQEPNEYTVDIKNTVGWNPTPNEFAHYDVVFCVVGIAHIKETKENRQNYYVINRDLVIKIANAAKAGGVKQFILLSSMSVYGLTVGHITKSTMPHPVNAYGDSKLQADQAIEQVAYDSFKFACLRPSMVYGKGCKGNYQRLRNFSLSSPIFPEYRNQRSMIYIGNLCEFVKQVIDEEKEGIFFPQNEEYVATCEMAKTIAGLHCKSLKLTKLFKWGIANTPVDVVKKAFGNLTYEAVDLVSKYGFHESMALTEGK